VAITLCIAHRGASAEAPENTLRAFRRALTLGADGIELDVHVTRDRVVVVFHDDHLRRLTGTAGKIATKSWRELRSLRVQGTEAIPSLVEVLRLTRGRAVVQIEIKPGVPVAPVVRAVQAARAQDWVIFASFSPAIVATALRLAPTVPRLLISDGRRSLTTLARQSAACAAAGLSLDHRKLRSAANVRYFHSRGLTVWCWTVNDARKMRRLATWGVDAILSDHPGLLRRTLAAK
jgi:glycerophosphoryl diester phosphodiesterase